MKLPLSFPFVRRSGFSLVELLTSITILSFVLVILVKMVGLVSVTWSDGQRQVSNLTKARAMLDLMARDVQAGVYRNDLRVFPDLSGTLALFTKQPSISGSRNISLVTYALDANTTSSWMYRGDMGMDWTPQLPFVPFSYTSGSAAASGTIASLVGSNAITLREMVHGVVGWRVVFVLADGTLSLSYPDPGGVNPARIIGFTIVAIDDKTLKRLTGTNISTLRTNLSRVIQTGAEGQTPKAVWESYLNNPAKWNGDGNPKGITAGINIFERYVSLP
jgi:prepilin-type N-terminal cleavage/methylation domain-containing protein